MRNRRMKRKGVGKATLEGLKVTLDEIGEMLGFVVERMVTKEDLKDFATKDDLFTLQTQLNGIETDIRSMKNSRLELRVSELEEKVFGEAR